MILDKIVAHKRKEIEQSKKEATLAAIRARAQRATAPRDFAAALRSGYDNSGIALISEIKKASPSAGIIRTDFNPVEIAKIYEQSGASAISVITDEEFFKGSLSYLANVRATVDLPLLRKDFIIHPCQIYEALAFGADAVLLIVAILSDQELKVFLELCDKLGLAALVEVHTEQERDRALIAGAKIIGINNRSLQTFKVDLDTTLRVAKDLPKDILCVSESGIKTADDVKRLQDASIHAMLVGTFFMKSTDIGASVVSLLGAKAKAGQKDKLSVAY